MDLAPNISFSSLDVHFTSENKFLVTFFSFVGKWKRIFKWTASWVKIADCGLNGFYGSLLKLSSEIVFNSGS